MDDIIKAKSYFAKKHRMGQAHVALSLLEEVRERLLLDFFLYCSDTETLLEETHGE
jgi:hypothetical protein